MSLLMDALRKAEADKHQAAKMAGPDEPGSGARSDAATDGAPEAARAGAVPDGQARPRRGRSDPGGDAQRSGAERATRVHEELALEPLADEDAFDLDEDLADTVDLAEKRGREGAAAAPPPSQTSTFPSARAVESELERYFNEAPSVQLPQAAATAGDKAALPPVSDAGATVVTAQTVFTAGDRGSSRRALGISMAMVAVLAVVLLGAGIFYFQKTPVTRSLPSPLVASTVERPAPKALPIVPLGLPPRSETSDLVRLEPAESAPPAGEGRAAAAAAVEPAGEAAEVVGEAPEPGAPGGASEAATAPVAASAPEALAPAPTAVAEHVEAPRAPPAPAAAAGPAEEPRPPPGAQARGFADIGAGVRPGEVRIARAPRSRPADQRLSSAYASFLAGDLAAAQGLYREILAVAPKERDALLGVAAIALQDGRVEEAHRHYAAVLDLDPADPTANAAVFMLEGGAGEHVTESRLKMLLDRGANVSYIHFALGNLYARQRRWADAQRAFFDAYRSDAANPDYSLNLAVSLDHMGQHGAALGYYQKALALADESGGSFDTELVLARIQELASRTGP